MRIGRHTVRAILVTCPILLFAAALLLFAEDASAKRRHQHSAAKRTESTSSPDAGVADHAGMPAAPDSTLSPSAAALFGRRQEGTDSVSSPADVIRPTSQGGMADLGRKEQTSVGTAVVAPVAHPVVSPSGIGVSFKLDPRQMDSLYKSMGVGWISPPISVHADGRAGTTPTIEAKASVPDTTGQPLDIHAEWIPADSEMVTVSPTRGTEVQLTVKQAGQSSLRVAYQKAYKELSIKAWYEGNALEAEISEKP